MLREPRRASEGFGGHRHRGSALSRQTGESRESKMGLTTHAHLAKLASVFGR